MDVVRVRVDGVTGHVGRRRQWDAPALPAAAVEPVAAVIAVAGDNSAVSQQRNVADTALAVGPGVPHPARVTVVGVEDDEAVLVVAGHRLYATATRFLSASSEMGEPSVRYVQSTEPSAPKA